MNKIAIIYASRHHGSTRKLVEAIANKHQITLIDASKHNQVDLSEYDKIGFASGIDFGKFYECVEVFLEKNLPENKKVFFLFTCAKLNANFTNSIRAKALEKGTTILGEYGCKGYNTYGPWKLIGGMNKNHPDAVEMNEVVLFYESILEM